MKTIKTIKLLAVSTAVLSLFGCAATQQAEKEHNDRKAKTQELYNSTNDVISNNAASVGSKEKYKNFSKIEKNWVSSNPIENSEQDIKLPNEFKKNVTFTAPGTVSLVEIISEFQRESKVKFELSNDIYDTNGGSGRLMTLSPLAASAKANPLTISDFVFEGSLKDALDLLTQKANVSWKWNGSKVEVYKFEVKNYNISAIMGSTNVNSSVSLGGSSSGGSNTGSSSAGVTRTSEFKTWDEIKVFLAGLMSGQGSLSTVETAGSISIKDIPSAHRKIEKELNKLNAKLTQQVHLNVDIYSVSDTSGDDIGIDWNTAFAGSIDGTSSAISGSIGGFTSTTNGLLLSVLQGPFAGNKTMISALNKVGKANVLNQFSVKTLNGQPAPIAANTKIGYVSEVKVTPSTVAGGSPTVDIKQSELNTGVNMNVIPKIEPNGELILEYVMNLSGLKDRTSFSSNGSSIELITSDLKSIANRAVLKSGQTLILTGFKQLKNSSNKQGVGSADNIALGGRVNSKNEYEYLVVAVTPYVVQNSK